jgi:hypothetical protein
MWADRYHARILRTPREVRNALVYVLNNWRKHIRSAQGLDPCSSARWFEGWRTVAAPADVPRPIVKARTWLARIGWLRHGLIDVDERPRSAPISPQASVRASRRVGQTACSSRWQVVHTG